MTYEGKIIIIVRIYYFLHLLCYSVNLFNPSQCIYQSPSAFVNILSIDEHTYCIYQHHVIDK
jgi:hypothetical protein